MCTRASPSERSKLSTGLPVSKISFSPGTFSMSFSVCFQDWPP